MALVHVVAGSPVLSNSSAVPSQYLSSCGQYQAGDTLTSGTMWTDITCVPCLAILQGRAVTALLPAGV